jgi:hypothetical protein
MSTRTADLHRGDVVLVAFPFVASGDAGRHGRRTGIRLDSVVDCQTLVTVPREEIVARLGELPGDVMAKVDSGLRDALGLRS